MSLFFSPPTMKATVGPAFKSGNEKVYRGT